LRGFGERIVRTAKHRRFEERERSVCLIMAADSSLGKRKKWKGFLEEEAVKHANDSCRTLFGKGGVLIASSAN